MLHLKKDVKVDNSEELCIVEALQQSKKSYYSTILNKLGNRAVFNNIENSMFAFEKYFNKSKAFAKVFYFNFAILAFLTMIGLTRLITGVLRDQPL